jgi:hypothetical protein
MSEREELVKRLKQDIDRITAALAEKDEGVDARAAEQVNAEQTHVRVQADRIPLNRQCRAYLIVGSGWFCDHCKFQHPIPCSENAMLAAATGKESV